MSAGQDTATMSSPIGKYGIMIRCANGECLHLADDMNFFDITYIAKIARYREKTSSYVESLG